MLVSGCFAEVCSGLAYLNISAPGVIFGTVLVSMFCNLSCAFAARDVRRFVSRFPCYGPGSLCLLAMLQISIE
jgi:hypothetical protein